MIEQYSSTTPNNQYTFHCPTVKRDARYIMCAFKKSKHWRGEDFADQDCRCAMRGGKCPVVKMITQEYRQDEKLWFSNSPEAKKLPVDLSNDLSRIVLFPFHAQGLNLTEQNKIDLFGSNVNVPTEVISHDEPTITAEPKRTKKPRAARVSSRDARDDVAEGFAVANIDTAAVINSSLTSP